MATVIPNSVIKSIRGRIGDLVFKQVHGRTIVSKRARTKQPNTPAQLAQRERFSEAAAYARAALADPDRRAFYAKVAARRRISAYNAALGDFLKPPVITAIELDDDHGPAGGRIRVVATDDAAVASVIVTIFAADGTLLEQGPARNLGDWHYRATTAAPPGRGLTIQAAAVDHAGNGVESRIQYEPSVPPHP